MRGIWGKWWIPWPDCEVCFCSNKLLVLWFSFSRTDKQKRFIVRKPNPDDSISVKEQYIHAKVTLQRTQFLPSHFLFLSQRLIAYEYCLPELASEVRELYLLYSIISIVILPIEYSYPTNCLVILIFNHR